MTKVNLALEKCVFEELVDVHMKASELRPPLSIIKSRMFFKQRAESTKNRAHSVACFTVIKLTMFPTLPGVPYVLKKVRGLGSRLFCFLKKTMHVKFSWAGIAFNPQGNLQSHQSNRVIIPCCGTHRDELDLVFRVAMWVEGDSPFETTIVGKAEAGGSRTSVGHCIKPVWTW